MHVQFRISLAANSIWQDKGAAFVAARVGVCCEPRGIFFAVHAGVNLWTLTDSLNVDNPATWLDVGTIDVKPNTWYNLSLSVIDRTVNAWVGTTQVPLLLR